MKTKEVYIKVCYAPINVEDKYCLALEDGKGVLCCLFGEANRVIYRGSKSRTPYQFPTRALARKDKFHCDRVWLVRINKKTGKIVQWIKKNP